MRLDIEFPILTTGSTQSKSAPKLVALMETITADIPEYTADQAPLALRIRPRMEDPVAFLAARDVNMMPREYFSCDGSLYEKCEQPRIVDGRIGYAYSRRSDKAGSGAFHEKVHEELFNAAYHKGNVLPRKFMEFHKWSSISLNDDCFRLPELAELGLETVDRDRIDAAIAAFREEVARFIIIDGMFHKRVPEPVYRLRNDPENGPMLDVMAATELESVHLSVKPTDDFRLFRADQLDEAFEETDGRLQEIGWGRPKRGLAQVIDILIGPAVAFDAASANLLIAGEAVRQGYLAALTSETLGGNGKIETKAVIANLERTSADAFVAFKALSRAIRRAEQNDGYEELADSIRQCLSLTGDGDDVFATASRRQTAEKALSDWDDRTVEVPFSPNGPTRR